MRICVYGAGAVGGNLAARLARAGVPVCVVARGAHLQAIRSAGLRLQAGEEEIVAKIAASDDPRDLGPQDAVFVTVKAHALASIAAQLPALLGTDTPVVFALNGIPWWYHAELPPEGKDVRAPLDPGGSLARSIGPRRTIGCTVYSSNEMLSPGVIRNFSAATNRFVLGEPDGELSDRCTAIGKLLSDAGIAAPVTARIREEIWKKLLLNVANFALCCLSGRNLREVAANEELRALGLALMRETLAVAAAHGVVMPDDPERLFSREMPPHKPSMLQDLERGRMLEIDAIYTAVGDFARAAGVATPLMDMLATLLRHRAATAGLYQLLRQPAG